MMRAGRLEADPLPPGHGPPLTTNVPGLSDDCLGGVNTPDLRGGPPAEAGAVPGWPTEVDLAKWAARRTTKASASAERVPSPRYAADMADPACPSGICGADVPPLVGSVLTGTGLTVAQAAKALERGEDPPLTDVQRRIVERHLLEHA